MSLLAQEGPLCFSVSQGSEKIITSAHYASFNFKTRERKYVSMHQSAVLDSSLSIYAPDSIFGFIRLSFPARGGHYFGMGEQYSHLDLRGTRPYVFTEEQGIGRGDKPVSSLTKLLGVSGNTFSSYAPMNFFFVGPDLALILKGGPIVRYDFSRPDSFTIDNWSGQLNMQLVRGKNPKEILYTATEITGRMPVLPDWAFGAWLGLQGGRDKVEKIVDKALNAGTPVSAVWIQDWVGRRKTRFGSQLWWTWQADTAAYPDFRGFCAEMKGKNIRVLGYINSFIANSGDLCAETKAKNYLIKNKSGEDYIIKTAGFPAYLIDLTNPQAFVWFKSVIKRNLIDAGLSGWMADYGEWLPADAKLYSGEDALSYHNQYAVDWARLNREAISEAGREGDIVFFTRSGALGAARYSTLFWAGDQMVDWGRNDGLPTAVCAMITSGLSGISLNHSDIGGYTTIDNPLLKVRRDEELLKRWIEFAAFTPVFRTHEGLKPESNIQVYSNDSILTFFARFANIHSRLKDYFKRLNREATEQGMPVTRALLLNYPSDTMTYDLKDEFLLGDDMLVAPVLEKGAKIRKVYFPDDVWINVWTGEEIKGPTTRLVNSTIGSPPVFVRKNSEWAARLLKIFESL